MGLEKHSDGHVLLGGARWHHPAPGQPTVCAVPDCKRVLGQERAVTEAQYDEDDLDEHLPLIAS